ncbi:MAG: hypothetical protein ABI664_02365 [bacterium]
MSEAESGSASGAEVATRAPQLSRELTEFLVELSVAMHKHAIYPPGHPLLSQAVDAVHRSLHTLLQERPALSIGVARRQLIIEGVATGAVHPLLAELAGKLHRHHIGAVKFVRGLSRDELSDALGTVGVEPQRDEKPLGMQPELIETRWINVKLFPLLYDRLELLDEEEEASTKGRPAGPQDGRAAQLWVGLARAAIAAEQGPDRDISMEPETVANAIDEHGREPAYDQAIVGYLLQIAHEVRHDDTPVAASAGLKRRISKLVGALKPATLQRLLEMGGDGIQRRKFVLDAAQGMSVDAVVELVQAAATAEGQTISHSLVRMLTKLASHASAQASLRSQAADGAFREHVERLVGSWSLDDPNPLAYSAALEQMSRNGADDSARAGEWRFPCEPSRVIAMALEMGVEGQTVTRAIGSSIHAESFAELLDLLDAAPADRDATIDYVWKQIAAADPLAALLASPRLDHTLIRRVVARTGASAAPALLAALDASPEGARRERLLGYLSSLGEEVAPEIAARLGQASPSLARELLASLARLAPRTLPVEARTFLTHADPALRREAAKLLLAYDDTRDSAMSVAIRDDDERVMYAGLLAAQERCSALIASTIRQRMDRGDITDSTAMVAAVRAVGNIADDITLDWMLKRTIVPGGLLRRPRLAPTTPELLAALSVLAARWGDDPRAASVLEHARTSASPTVRAAVQLGGRPTMDRERPS